MQELSLQDLDLTAPEHYVDLQLWLHRNFAILAQKTWHHVSLPLIDVGQGGTKLVLVTMGNYNTYEFAINSEGVFNIEIPHNLDLTSDVHLHLSWLVDEAYATANAEVQWEFSYSLVAQDGSEVLDAPTRTGVLTTGDLNLPTTAKTIAHAEVTIPASALENVTDLLGVVAKRIALIDGVNPTATPRMVSLHLEYQSDKLGTIEEH